MSKQYQQEFQGRWPHMQHLEKQLKDEEIVMDANGWRPISEAPKDGSKFLAGWFSQPRINGAKHWVEMIMQYKDNPLDSKHLVSCLGEWHYKPTHFMPLPQPPAQEAK